MPKPRKALQSDESGTVNVGGTDWFLHAHNPPLRLIVVGAVHIAQALVPFATQCGFAVIVVDPRRSFASDERFPNVTVSTAWPDEAMDELKPDTRTAVVTLTHDPKLDDPALDRALKSPAFYIGSLGSRRTHAARLKRLRELGHGDNALHASRAPSASTSRRSPHRKSRYPSSPNSSRSDAAHHCRRSRPSRHEVRPRPARRSPRRHHGALANASATE